MALPSQARFPQPELTDLPEDLRTRILAVQEKAGFVPHVFLSMAHRPDEFRAFFAYHDAVMERADSGLTKGEREMIVTATSALNNNNIQNSGLQGIDISKNRPRQPPFPTLSSFQPNKNQNRT